MVLSVQKCSGEDDEEKEDEKEEVAVASAAATAKEENKNHQKTKHKGRPHTPRHTTNGLTGPPKKKRMKELMTAPLMDSMTAVKNGSETGSHTPYFPPS